MLSLIVTSQNGSFEVMPLINQLTWSGSYQQGARKLSFDLVSSPYDQSVKAPDLSPGNAEHDACDQSGHGGISLLRQKADQRRRI